ncbi:hypothetical protein [Ornithinimicrobium kibberense]|uniref:hypothetical protein n=1 Tax=Ornithinimicrobium kibberense TaxID=282060 RepID=UPI00361C5733
MLPGTSSIGRAPWVGVRTGGCAASRQVNLSRTGEPVQPPSAPTDHGPPSNLPRADLSRHLEQGTAVHGNTAGTAPP